MILSRLCRKAQFTHDFPAFMHAALPHEQCHAVTLSHVPAETGRWDKFAFVRPLEWL
jgi:hypothetical protein